jgi:hypothetical protein
MLSAALHVLAGDVCLQIGCADKCRVLTKPLPGIICPDSPSTWLCDSHFFTLFKSNGGTLLFSHTNEVLYHASMDAQLSQDCPDLCFLCQFTTDSMPEGDVPRLLVFDLNVKLPAAARGEMLWGLQIHLPPLCCVQWIGPRQFLTTGFISSLPHKIRGVVALGSDPLVFGNCELMQ